ncbi:MAG: hypothetical protein LBR22_00705 [Desulfovibrio sp.]|nr:hypothetical protein [Desulfovibrio sp.]
MLHACREWLSEGVTLGLLERLGDRETMAKAAAAMNDVAERLSGRECSDAIRGPAEGLRRRSACGEAWMAEETPRGPRP